ncbi:MAG: hypothetical protein M1825_002009 [Sarcosagium campestre]|nr:MAG: hypothetical protein M1825_002009 [Sarcosagium campestre]
MSSVRSASAGASVRDSPDDDDDDLLFESPRARPAVARSRRQAPKKASAPAPSDTAKAASDAIGKIFGLAGGLETAAGSDVSADASVRDLSPSPARRRAPKPNESPSKAQRRAAAAVEAAVPSPKVTPAKRPREEADRLVALTRSKESSGRRQPGHIVDALRTMGFGSNSGAEALGLEFFAADDDFRSQPGNFCLFDLDDPDTLDHEMRELRPSSRGFSGGLDDWTWTRGAEGRTVKTLVGILQDALMKTRNQLAAIALDDRGEGERCEGCGADSQYRNISKELDDAVVPTRTFRHTPRRGLLNWKSSNLEINSWRFRDRGEPPSASLRDRKLKGVLADGQMERSGACGGFIGDEIGLGKTMTVIALIVIERWLSIIHNDITASRAAGNPTHLPVGEDLPPQEQVADLLPLRQGWTDGRGSNNLDTSFLVEFRWRIPCVSSLIGIACRQRRDLPEPLWRTLSVGGGGSKRGKGRGKSGMGPGRKEPTAVNEAMAAFTTIETAMCTAPCFGKIRGRPPSTY